MKICNTCKIDKPLVDFSKDKRQKDNLRRLCRACDKVYNQAWRKKNPEKARAKDKSWRESNPGKRRLYHANRRAAILERTPKWLTPEDLQEMQFIYNQAWILSQIIGEEFQVDHKDPLRGDKVSGLHCPTNLQIITAEENRYKSNG